jgi:hypothetical protein
MMIIMLVLRKVVTMHMEFGVPMFTVMILMLALMIHVILIRVVLIPTSLVMTMMPVQLMIAVHKLVANILL